MLTYVKTVLHHYRKRVVHAIGARALRALLDHLHDYLETSAATVDEARQELARTVFYGAEAKYQHEIPVLLHQAREILGGRKTDRDEALFQVMETVAAEHRSPAN